jgi:succinoglycan biosynthesis transport protein ExoP
MSQPLPQLEILTAGTPPPAPAGSWLRSHRARIFLAVFLICLGVGQTFNFLRPAVYRSSATVLTVAQPAVDTNTQVTDLDLQHVAVQRQLLLGQPLLERTLERLRAGGQAAHFGVESVDDFRASLAVSPVPSTHLVELSADGPRPDLLPVLVNAWIESYLSYRQQAVREELGDTMDALDAQLKELDDQLRDSRSALERFRSEHGILSEGRTENRAHAKLLGLNQALSQAREREVEALSQLQSVKEAIDRGEPLVPDSEKSALGQMQLEAAELRDRLKDYEQRYTRQYRFVEPEFDNLPQRLQELERRIARSIEQGGRLLLTESEQALRSARSALAELERRMQAHRAEATEFTARFAEYEAMRKDLEALETLHRDTAQRRAELESRSLEKYPQVRVVDWAYKPLEPMHPDYLRDALWVLLGAGLLGVLAVWLVEYLRRSPQTESRPGTLAGVRIFADRPAAALPTQPSAPLATRTPGGVLSPPAVRELTRPEIQALWEAADDSGRLLLGLLLAGLSLEEAAQATRADLEPDDNLLRVAGRRLPLAPTVTALLGDEPAVAGELAADLKLLAHDAGLPFPDQVDPSSLRHTYILYLVRQGARLRELERVVGPVPASQLTAYSPYSPQGPGKPLADLELLYPLPQGLLASG